MDRHRFDTDMDPDCHLDDADPHPDPTPSFTHVPVIDTDPDRPDTDPTQSGSTTRYYRNLQSIRYIRYQLTVRDNCRRDVPQKFFSFF